MQPFPEGRYSTHILMIDFSSDFGTKKSLAKQAPNYEGNNIVGRLVLFVVNFRSREIGKHKSEVLMLNVPMIRAMSSCSILNSMFPLVGGGGRLF